MKILINTPDLSLSGGVANHYKGLLNFWKQDISYNFIGSRRGIPGRVLLLFDLLKFIILCAFGEYDLILLNPSLGTKAIKRDSLYLKISNIFKIKTVVFIHGWENKMERKISRNPEPFIRAYDRADAFIVLAHKFKNHMINWGITRPIHLSTTKVDDHLLRNFDLSKKNPDNITILFLARIEENKGILIALKAFEQVVSKYPEAQLKVAGNGSALRQAQILVSEKSIRNVEFLGNISGSELIESFGSSMIYILPTQHGEGMPTSILEAMAFGLPIISRPVGGLVDFFEEEKMGYLIQDIIPNHYSSKIIELIENPEKTRAIGQYNYEFAQKQFLASKVVLQLENILLNIGK